MNPPKYWHVVLAADLLMVTVPLAAARGLRAFPEPMGLFGADDDWRVPDQVVARPGSTYGDAGLATAELVVEIRSPGDDSYRKLPFYAERGVREVLILHEDRRVELFRPTPEGEMAAVVPEADGSVRSEVLDVVLATVEGPLLRLTWDGGSAEV